MLMQLAHQYSKLPHELLHMNIDDFNFDLAVTIVGNQKTRDMQKEPAQKNSFADSSDNSSQFTQGDFERVFKVETE